MWTTSSATSRWPRSTRSSTHSLFPIPERPRNSRPTPNTSASDACTVVAGARSEEHTSELQSRFDLVCRLLLEKKKKKKTKAQKKKKKKKCHQVISMVNIITKTHSILKK